MILDGTKNLTDVFFTAEKYDPLGLDLGSLMMVTSIDDLRVDLVKFGQWGEGSDEVLV